MGEMLGHARRLTGLSTRAVVASLRPRGFALSHVALSKYERDQPPVPSAVLEVLAAFYDRQPRWFRGDQPTLHKTRYRDASSKVGVRDRRQLEGACQRWIDAYLAIEQYAGQPLERTLTFTSRVGDEPPAAAAGRLRSELKLDDRDPLPSVIELLESLGIRVMHIDTTLAVAGLAGLNGEDPVVFINTCMPNDRTRITAAHEAAHVIRMHSDNPTSHAAEERDAFEFASHLLLTSRMLAEAFSRKSVVDLLRFKVRFGISLAAMVHRAGREGLISQQESRRLWIEFGKRGWRRSEPGDVWPDRATRFEAIVDSLLVAGVSLRRLAAVSGVSEAELRHRLAQATGADDYDEAPDDSGTGRKGLRIVP